MDHLVAPDIAALLDGERDVLTRLAALLDRTGADPDAVDRLHEIIDRLDQLFLVVVVGEFNAGKSTVLNALFGEKLMEEGPIPTTAKITILRHGEEPMERQLSEYLVERRHPADLLRHLHLVDTPGTNSIIRQHQTITERFIPRSDLVLFVTSFDRPLAESERQFLEFIREAWGRRLVFVLNKADQARTEDHLTQVVEHIKSGCRDLMGFEPTVFPVSAEQAYAAKTAEKESVQNALWRESRFAPLEQFITETLTGPERLALKLNAPLDAAAKRLDALRTRLDARRDVLAQDEANLAEVQDRLDAARETLENGVQRHLTEVDNLLLQMERRGVQFLNDSIRVSKLNLLRDKDRFKEEFQRQVLRDTDRQIEDQVTEAVDHLFEQALVLWQRTLREFTERLHTTADGAGGDRKEFLYNRADVFNTVMREAERKIQTHDLREEARRILENAANAADTLQAASIGAAGLGVLSGVIALTTALDAVGGFGLVTAGVVGAAGLTVLPRQRRKAIQEFEDHIETLRGDMKQALGAQFSREVDTSLAKLEETVDPYRRLVDEERTTLETATAEHDALRESIDRLREQVHEAVGTPDLEE
jgi:small GTP-binding protein